jgi:hypothetical protein
MIPEKPCEAIGIDLSNTPDVSATFTINDPDPRYCKALEKDYSPVVGVLKVFERKS